MTDSVLVTGSAGFIGFHVAKRLLEEGRSVVGVDNLNDYYDVQLKRDRNAELEDDPNYEFEKFDLKDRGATEDLFARYDFDGVVHLAAQAGVRYSLDHPHTYIDSNIQGFLNILEGCRHQEVGHLVFASSSSVYGANTKMPLEESDNVDHPVSLYAATKKSNELMAHSYAHLYDLPVTGLRFFTVYGPWGRPDMAYFLFTDAIVDEESIDVYNYGDMQRDFTYVDDVVEGVTRVLDRPAEPDPDWDGDDPNPATSKAPYKIYNIGNNDPVELMDMIEAVEEAVGVEAEKNFMPMQPGDVQATYADCDRLADAVDFEPDTPLTDGIARFIDWYTDYYDADLPGED